MANPGQELSSINFQSMIGGPLTAVIKAQTQSSIAAVDFIQSVGFESDADGNTTKPTMVSFSYQKMVDEEDADGNINPTPKDFELTVPFLTMLPIPFIRIEETTIDFNAKINSITESKQSSSHDLGAALKAKAGWGWGSAELSVNYSYKKSSSSSDKTERTYTMAIHVKAVQDELPAGTERLLSILENTIQETQKTA